MSDPFYDDDEEDLFDDFPADPRWREDDIRQQSLDMAIQHCEAKDNTPEQVIEIATKFAAYLRGDHEPALSSLN